MAGRLLRCKRCRQPILSDSRCCPHCAVALPVRRLGAGAVFVAAVLIAAAAWLLRSNGTHVTNGVASIVDSTTTALKTAGGSRSRSQPGLPDSFADACSSRGGTVVEVDSRDGASLRRCALTFDDTVR
ncbi:hypothetical protein [Methylobacterium gnaphalii]|uniref:hypothetical protein n=1 Tax=Methylobacterium gnaphalii TaxID=1010610 RepID=UPI0011BE2F90|nr:hypothetical protein [Methylobacterium gnaphalii]GJD71488.1 hypothetical protein MMMDOFMJ_4448 [Methylobacterium gnaphalii]